MLRLNGITPVMCTPFLEDDSIDEVSLRRQIDFAIDNGAAAISGPGYGSEFYKMTDGERCRFAEILVDQARKRVPVIVATSKDSTRATVELSRFAERISADCVMVTPPRTAALPVGQIIDYYSRLCDQLTIPVMLQDADFTGAGLPSKVFADISRKHQNFQFAKLEILLPGQKCAEIVEQTEGRVQVIYGLGGIAMMDGFRRGASAVMPGAAVLEVYVRAYKLYRAGHVNEAKSFFNRLIPYLSFVLQHLELAVGTEKRILAKRGIIDHHRMRHPSLAFDSATEELIGETVDLALSLCEEAIAAAPAGKGAGAEG
ncbi:MAG: dihydrodipicolinate synthase family protein [Bryobacteraceae bacterium]